MMPLGDLFIFGATLILGIWIGVSAPEGNRSALSMLGIAFLSFVIAAIWFDVRCPGGSLADVIFLRNIPGEYFCNTRFALMSYVFLIAAPIAAIRRHLTKPLPPHDS